ncbi:MAG: YfhO family protein, partial [Oscillospiraceae bacterium]|nr:YfhO family protein [Oscillospiraceae bacterium]
VTVRVPMKEDNKSGSVKIYVYQLNQDALLRGYEYLDQNRLHLSEFADTHFKGTVSSDTGRVLYMSVPFEKGWTVYVDGKKGNLIRLFDAMCAVNLEPGSHEIEMRYSPQGFVPGAVIAVLSAVGLMLLFLLERRKSQKKTEKKDSTPAPKPETDKLEDAPEEPAAEEPAEEPEAEEPAEEETPAEEPAEVSQEA